MYNPLITKSESIRELRVQSAQIFSWTQKI
jgi:hypothetical protein